MSSDTASLKGLQSKLTRTQKARLRKAVKSLDKEFLREKADLVKETVLEILRDREKTPNVLLQRNVWSSLDAMALHLDHTGFTRVFQDVAPVVLKKLRFDDPGIIAVEWELMLDYLGVDKAGATRLGLAFAEIEGIMKWAEAEKRGTCGLPRITRKDFSFKKVFAEFCGRPDKMLEVHHSPQLKIIACIIIEILNLVAGLLGVASIIGWWLGVGIFIVSTIVVLIIACLGC